MSILTRLMRGALASLALATATLSASAAPTTQLGFLIDDSGSIGAANFDIMKAGYASALAGLPTDGSIEITIYKFSTGAQQVVAPTVVTAANLASVIAAVSGMNYDAGSTFTAAGIRAITNAMVSSANYDEDLRSIINIATDGVPNDDSANPQQNAINAANASRDAGIDAMTAEAIGGVDIGFLKDLVFSPVAGPCSGCGVEVANPNDPMTNLPWILRVDDFADFPTAINAKVQAIVNTVPEPDTLALVALTLAVAGLQSRRRKV